MLKKWKLIKTETLFTSKYISLEKNKYTLPDGTSVDDLYTFQRGDFVLIVAENAANEILLERQYRCQADDFVYELPAGWIEKNETPLEAAKRELNEEAGLYGNGQAVGPFYVLPGTSRVKSFVVVMKILESVKTNSNPISNEDMELGYFSLAEIDKMILDGEIKDEGLLVGISVLKALKNK